MALTHGRLVFLEVSYEVIDFLLDKEVPQRIQLTGKWDVPFHGFIHFVKYTGPGEKNLVNFGIKWSQAETQVAYQGEEIASHLYLDRKNHLVLVLPEKRDHDATPDTFYWIPQRNWNKYIPVEHLAIKEANIEFRNAYTTTTWHGFAEHYDIADTRYWVIQFRYDMNMELACVSVFMSVGGPGSCVYVPVKDEIVVNLLRKHVSPDALQKLQTYAPGGMPNILMVGK